MSKPWPKVRLGDVLKPTARPVEVKSDELYREIGIRSHGKGVFHKAPISGLELGNKRVFWVQPGDFVLNIVFAWEGAVAVLSEAEAGMIGSHRFPTFRADEARLDSRFLLAYFKTREGLALLRKVSPGGAGRNRTLSRTALLEQCIPLPSLGCQQELVTQIEELYTFVSEARTLRRQSIEEASVLLASQTNAIFTGTAAAHWPSRSLDELAEVRSGVTLGRQLNGPVVRLPYLRVANVQDGALDLSEVKEIDVLATEADKWSLKQGDVLLTEGGDWDKLGRGTVWRNEIPHCIHQNHIFRLRLHEGTCIPEFAARILSSPIGKSYFQEASKQTTNLASINQRQLKAFRMFQPPLTEQRRIVAELDALQTRVDELKCLQAETAAELDAMLPALLDRAFGGAM